MLSNSILYSKICTNFDIYLGTFCFDIDLVSLPKILEGTELAEDAVSVCTHPKHSSGQWHLGRVDLHGRVSVGRCSLDIV